MNKEQIISIDGTKIYTNGGRCTAIGNADHKVGDWVWVDSGCVFGHSVPVNSIPYLPAEADTIINATADVVSAVRISGTFHEWTDIEPTYNNVTRYICYNEAAICTMTGEAATVSWKKKYLNGIIETGSFPFVGSDRKLSKAYLDKDNKLCGTFLKADGVYTFVDNEVTLLSAGFPSAFPTTPSHADDKYNYVYYASDDNRFYDSFLGNKILFSTEGFSKWIINEEHPLEEWYKNFLTIGGSKIEIGYTNKGMTNIPYRFNIGVHADYYVEWVNDGSASCLTATSIKFKSKDDSVNAVDTDITPYVIGRYMDLLKIMPVLVINKKYMLLSFGDYMVLFNHDGKVLANQKYEDIHTLDRPIVTKKVAGRLIDLLR